MSDNQEIYVPIRTVQYWTAELYYGMYGYTDFGELREYTVYRSNFGNEKTSEYEIVSFKNETEAIEEIMHKYLFNLEKEHPDEYKSFVFIPPK